MIDMSKTIEIRIAELFAGDHEYTIVTNGVGSCVVIVLYDALARVGGMAHAILPRSRGELYQKVTRDADGRLFAKYADTAIDLLVLEVEARGASRDNLVAKLVGGAHMFTLLDGDKHGIGFENTEAARTRLTELDIRIETEVIGGTVGRNVYFDCATGVVEIITKV